MHTATTATDNPFAKAAAVARTRGENDLARRISSEGRIAHKLITHALAAGYVISIYDGEEWCLKQSRDLEMILAAMSSTDTDDVMIRNPVASGSDGGFKRVGCVSLVYGNGNELISDYSAPDLDVFSAWLKPVEDFAEEA